MAALRVRYNNMISSIQKFERLSNNCCCLVLSAVATLYYLDKNADSTPSTCAVRDVSWVSRGEIVPQARTLTGACCSPLSLRGAYAGSPCHPHAGWPALEGATTDQDTWKHVCVQVYERRREYQREEKSGRGRQRAEFATTETGAGFTCNNFNLSRIGFHYNG